MCAKFPSLSHLLQCRHRRCSQERILTAQAILLVSIYGGIDGRTLAMTICTQTTSGRGCNQKYHQAKSNQSCLRRLSRICSSAVANGAELGFWMLIGKIDSPNTSTSAYVENIVQRRRQRRQLRLAIKCLEEEMMSTVQVFWALSSFGCQYAPSLNA